MESASGKGIGPGTPNVRNIVTLNERKFCVGEEYCVNIACVVQVNIGFCYNYTKLAGVAKNNNTDANTMCGNPLFPVTQKVYLPQPLPPL